MILNPRTEADNDRQVELVLSSAGDILVDETDMGTFINTNYRLQANVSRVDTKHYSAKPSAYIARVLRSLQYLPNLTIIRSIYARGDPDATGI